MGTESAFETRPHPSQRSQCRNPRPSQTAVSRGGLSTRLPSWEQGPRATQSGRPVGSREGDACLWLPQDTQALPARPPSLCPGRHPTCLPRSFRWVLRPAPPGWLSGTPIHLPCCCPLLRVPSKGCGVTANPRPPGPSGSGGVPVSGRFRARRGHLPSPEACGAGLSWALLPSPGSERHCPRDSNEGRGGRLRLDQVSHKALPRGQ